MASKPHSSTFRGQLGIAFVPIMATYAIFLVLTALAIIVDLNQDKKQTNNGHDQYFEDLFHIAALPGVNNIARLLKMHKQSVIRAVSRFKELGTLEDRPRSGRPPDQQPERKQMPMADWWKGLSFLRL
ncbi:winged helix-turn helix domain-containing protein [Ditylenchus destructor]|uniref:Winged helix-turn helix domain-containing protein n=1 Tax=Ditylenchus destructor TaxID=166010 RepID=A0AAD4MNL8_9BILA|nr:winged helix-turn helix domain-containing protein [Ditylenchus destructor]